jgi:hypothetical protein
LIAVARWIVWFLAHAVGIAVVTALTQVGGIVYLLAMLVVALPRRRMHLGPFLRIGSGIFWFSVIYLIASAYVVPPLAEALGRVPLQCAAAPKQPYAPRSHLYCLLGRNYVKPETRELLEALATAMAAKEPRAIVAYLDAGFPFADWFTMLPHLSHGDGLHIDLAYFYADRDGRYRPFATPSPLGYWSFEAPLEGERRECTDRFRLLTLRWDMRWWQMFVAKHLQLDKARTADMLRWLVEEGPKLGVGRVLIEPHIPERLGVASPLIRFQGCAETRHDDHLQVEVIAKALR